MIPREALLSERRRIGATDRPLRGRAPAGVGGIDVGHDQQHVGAEVDREEGARQVLVDHGLDALESPARRKDGLVSP